MKSVKPQARFFMRYRTSAINQSQNAFTLAAAWHVVDRQRNRRNRQAG